MRNKRCVIRILRSALNLLAHKGGWTQHVAARDSAGIQIPAMSKRAVSFCSLGAIRHAGGNALSAVEARIALAEHIRGNLAGVSGIAEFNDAPRRRQRDVVRLFGRTIKYLERQP